MLKIRFFDVLISLVLTSILFLLTLVLSYYSYPVVQIALIPKVPVVLFWLIIFYGMVLNVEPFIRKKIIYGPLKKYSL